MQDTMSMTTQRQTTPVSYVTEFLARTREARERAGYETQAEMARALKMDPTRYSKYETRTPLPHYLLARFCQLTGANPAWMLGIADEVGELPATSLTMFVETVRDAAEDFADTGRGLDPHGIAEYTRLLCQARMNDKRHRKLPKRDARAILRLVK